MNNSRIIDAVKEVPVAYDEHGTIKELFSCVTQNKPISKDLAISALHWLVRDEPSSDTKPEDIEFCGRCHAQSNEILKTVCGAPIKEGADIRTDSCGLKGVLLAFIKLTTWQPDPYTVEEINVFVKAAVSDCDKIKAEFINRHGN